jgi:hypothetical protein
MRFHEDLVFVIVFFQPVVFFATAEIISRAFDVRLPLLFDEEDFDTILTIIEQSLDEVKSESGNKINSELQPQIANVVIPISNSNQTFVDATV